MDNAMAIPVSRRLDFSEIPQIDVSSLLDGAGSGAVIDELHTACRDVGFFYVRNHGVSQQLIADLREAAARFFEKPMDEKLRVHINARLRGYLPLDYSSYENEAREAKSHQEGFWIGYERADNAGHPLEGPNIWPDGHDDLKDVMLCYQTATENLAHALQRGFSQALGWGVHGLDHLFADPMTRLKLNHYPPQDSPETIKHIGVVPHTDSGAFTILWQDDGDGLEIENKSGEWIGAPSIPETFVINIGNIMQIWSDGAFSSTPHRVINRGGRDRFSIPVFVYPGAHAAIAPIGSEAQTPTDGPLCGAYLRDIWKRTFPIAGIT